MTTHAYGLTRREKKEKKKKKNLPFFPNILCGRGEKRESGGVSVQRWVGVERGRGCWKLSMRKREKGDAHRPGAVR